MKTRIYYFTGSGFSFRAAKELGSRLNTDPVRITKPFPDIIDSSGFDAAGFVFPVYHASFGLSGIPFIVEKFIEELPSLENKYVFAVCTHGGKPGEVLKELEKLIANKGTKLSYGVCVRLSVPYRADEKIKSVFLGQYLSEDKKADEDEAEELYHNWKSLSARIAIRVLQKKSCIMVEGYENKLFSKVSNVLQLKMAKTRYSNLSGSESDSFEVLVNKSDAGFRVNNNCTICGLCRKVCPAENIRIGGSGPEWQHHCENCFACFHWCPNEAIGGPLVEFEKRATAADVSAEDLCG